MKTYLLTSEKTEGTIAFGFNDAGLLTHFDVQMPTLDATQLGWFHAQLGNTVQLAAFEAWAVRCRFRLIEMLPDLSFEAWYNPYNVKRNKAEALGFWAFMSDEEKAKCIASNRGYLGYRGRNAKWYKPMYPDTYLRGKHYNDEWDKL